MSVLALFSQEVYRDVSTVLVNTVDGSKDKCPTSNDLSSYAWARLMPVLIRHIRKFDSDGIESEKGYDDFLAAVTELFANLNSPELAESKEAVVDEVISLFKGMFSKYIDALLQEIYEWESSEWRREEERLANQADDYCSQVAFG